MPDDLQHIRKLSETQNRVNAICTSYANGISILEELPVKEVAGLLDVDLGFNGNWEFTATPWSEPDESDLEQEDAVTVVAYLSNSSNRARLEELEKIAEAIDKCRDSKPTPLIKQLGLTKNEILETLKSKREYILCSDAGWDHCATLRLEGCNGWEIVFTSTYDEVDKNESYEIRPIPEIDRLRVMLSRELLLKKDGILESLNYALSQAKLGGGTAGHKHGSRRDGFKSLSEIAELIQRATKAQGS